MRTTILTKVVVQLEDGKERIMLVMEEDCKIGDKILSLSGRVGIVVKVEGTVED